MGIAVACAVSRRLAVDACGSSGASLLEREGQRHVGSIGAVSQVCDERSAAASSSLAPRRPLRARLGRRLGSKARRALSDGVIASRYTCKGSRRLGSGDAGWASPRRPRRSRSWSAASSAPGRFAVNWAVAGISPSVDGIAAGRLPPGAVVGLNSFGREGYSLCPAAGAKAPVTWIAVLALPHKIWPLDLASIRPRWRPQSTLPGVQWGSLLAYARRAVTPGVGPLAWHPAVLRPEYSKPRVQTCLSSCMSALTVARRTSS